MANEFIIRKGYKSLSDSQITGSLSVSNAVTASFFTGSFRGDGSELTGIDGFPFTGSASISGSLTVVGPVTATEFIGNGSQLTGIEGFPYTGSAIISGSLQVTGSISTDTDATINSLTVGKGGGNLDTNTAVGYNAFSSNTGGNFNVAIGYNALASSVEGDDNVAIGHNALSSSLASMGPNTAVGRGALQNNLYGFRNTAIGNASLFSNIQGDFNTAVGNTALLNNIDGHENIAIGDGALYDNTVGDYNTGVGTFAIHSNTGGNNNTAIGHSSLYYNLTGSNNIALGTDAGLFAGSGFTSLESVNNSIFVGYRTRALNAAGDTNEIVIGNNIVGLGSNTTVIGNNNTVSTTLKGAVSASLFSGSFVGDGSQLTGIADPTPITATIDNTDSPFTITNETIVIVDSTNGNVTINLPDLDTIVGTENQKPIVIYKNDYSQNVVFVSPNGSQLVNGTTQDIIVSIQIGIVYNPTSAGWVTEGNSYQSLAELELFFVPRTETGSLSVATASYVEYTDVVNKPTLVSGSSQISFSGITNKPTLVSGSSQITYSGLTGKPSGIVSSSVQVKEYNVFATTGSNGFNGNQAITGSLTVTGQVVAQTLNVQQVTSSIVYSSGSNIFGNELSNTQQFTGSMSVTGSLTVNGTNSLFNANNGTLSADILTVRGGGGTGAFGFKIEANNGEDIFYTNNFTYDIIANPVSGKFGIGTATPASKLDINIGNLSTAGAFSNAALNLYNPTNIGAYSQITFGYTVGATYAASYLGFVSTNQGSFGYGDLVFGTRNVNTDTQATERLRITSGGNVGINTTSPSDFIDAGLGLAIISTTGRTGLSLGSNQTVADEVLGRLSFTNTNSTNIGSKRLAYISGVRGNTNNSAYLEFGTANNGLGTQRMVISQEGNVGIGATPSAWNANSRALQLSSFISLSQQHNGALNLMSYALETSANTFTYADTGVFPSRLNMNPNDGSITLFGAGTGTAGNAITWASRLAFTSAGAATFSSSITTNTANNFNISSGPYNAVFHNSSTSTSDYNSIRITQGSAGSATGYFGTGGSTTGNSSFQNTFVIGTQSSHAFVLNTNDAERMRITSGGDVNFSGGAIRADGGYFAVRTSGGSAVSGYLLREATWLGSGTSTNLALAAEGGNALTFFTNGTTSPRMIITSGGNVLIGTTSNIASSKLRVNGNIQIEGFQKMYTYYIEVQPNTTGTITISSPTGTYMQGSMQVIAGGYGNSLSGNVTGLWMVGGLLFFDNASTSTITQIVNSVTANGSMSFQRSGDQYTVTLANTSSLYTKTFYVSVIINGD